MKTLDEVITELEDEELFADALHYLKKLKRIEERMERIALGNVEDTLSKMDNPPLTWDELKSMEGKPVWVEADDGKYKGWLIITDIKSNGAVGRGVYGENAPLYKDRIGTDWQAYRKERTNENA